MVRNKPKTLCLLLSLTDINSTRKIECELITRISISIDTDRIEVLLKKTILSLILLLLLCAGCNQPSSNSGTTTVTPTQAAATYSVIPLTSRETTPITATSYDLLHTVVTIHLYDSYDYDLLNECFALVDRYEKLLSRTIEGSEIYQLNHSTTNRFPVSDETKELIELSLYYSKLTNGALDISIAPVSALWNFTSGNKVSEVPPADQIEHALSFVDYSNVSIEDNEVVFAKSGMQLELGAVAKGFIADKVKEFLLSRGVKSAIIDLGGNVLLVGSKPDGSAFRVGVQKPFEDRNSVVVAISELTDVSMVSSGIYERFFYDSNGAFYHHILDSKTGYPCANDLLQVTIISKDSASGDALSTACFALGLEKGLELINSLEDVYAVFLTSDGTLHFSDGYLDTYQTQTE